MPSDHLICLLGLRRNSRRGYLKGLRCIYRKPLLNTDDLNTCLHFLVGHKKRTDVSNLMKKYPKIPRDLCTFNLLLALASRAPSAEAPSLVSEVYGQILLGGFPPNTTTMNLLLEFFHRREEWETLKRTHMDFRTHQVPFNEYTYVLLFQAAGMARDEKWLGMLRRMWLTGDRAYRTVHTYTALLEAYVWVDPSSSAGTFFLMQSEGVSGNTRTHLAMLNAACIQNHVKDAVFWLRRCGRQEAPYLALAKYLIQSDMYSEALLVRWDLQRRKISTTDSWSILWAEAFIKASAFEEADQELERLLERRRDTIPPLVLRELVRYYTQTQQVGKADSLMKVYAYGANGVGKTRRGNNEIDPAHEQVMSQAWTLLLASFARRGYLDDAFRLWRNMHISGGKGNPETASALIRACGYVKRGDRALDVWAELPDQGVPYTESLASSMLTALGRAQAPGLLDEFWRHLRSTETVEMTKRLSAVWVAAWARCGGQWARCLVEAKKYEESMDDWAWDVVITLARKSIDEGQVDPNERSMMQLMGRYQSYRSATLNSTAAIVKSKWGRRLKRHLSTMSILSVRNQMRKGPVPGLGGNPGWIRKLLGRPLF
ncbi:hypothetical protein BJ684DRAFT_18259 [Piptocephalis cylindrospora]|uniref:Uncharacterized protein n=1 Tax=Piptocephalis cylindrospora TaxID=1907219 RepID=A0A4P9Y8P8_9FUNG|nr:hypothetical protein BJ684DRAFT_18259 [Piptocephalis cylindrospora]|eukprot:RKP15405.1 hypothetical protein BJ684DRAFT_18259 [Piptocephalis cylindrospora]